MEEFRKKFVQNGHVIKGTFKSIDNHKFFFKCLGKELGYTERDDWYGLTKKKMKDNHGEALLNNYYSGSPCQFVKAMVPEVLIWKFSVVPKGYWDDYVNQKEYATWLGLILGYTLPKHWYQIKQGDIYGNCGSGLLTLHYSGSPSKFVKAMFPTVIFFDWEFSTTPSNFWDDYVNRQRYAFWLGLKLGYLLPKHWYKITKEAISNNCGGQLLSRYYSDSPSKFVKAMFPDFIFFEWLFNVTPNGFWKEYVNRKRYATWLGRILGYTLPEHWYQITKEAIVYNNGGGLLANYYSDSPIQFVRDMFPKEEFWEWMFVSVPQGFWKEYDNRKRYATWLGSKLGYTRQEHWYQLSWKLVNANYGGGLLLLYYSNSPHEFVRAIFPDDIFLEWKFTQVTDGFWDNIINQRQFINSLGEELRYTIRDHWYQITAQLIKDNGGYGLLQMYSHSPALLVKAMYPEYPWVSSKFRKSYSRGQIQWLEFLMVSTPDIRHALHEEGEMKIPNSRYSADGYSEVENCIYEYHGDFWHGNPVIYPSLEVNPVSKVTYGELYEKTLKKQKFCEEKSGYRYYFVWESSWMRGKIAVMNLQRMYRSKKI